MSNDSEHKRNPNPRQVLRRHQRDTTSAWLASYRLRDELEFVPDATPAQIAAAKAERDRLWAVDQAACLAAGRAGPPIRKRVPMIERTGRTAIVGGVRIPVYRRIVS